MNYFKAVAEQIYQRAEAEGRLIKGRSLAELKRIALRQDGVIQTQLGSVAADSELCLGPPLIRETAWTIPSASPKNASQPRPPMSFPEKNHRPRHCHR